MDPLCGLRAKCLPDPQQQQRAVPFSLSHKSTIFIKKNILSHYSSCFSKKNILSHYPSCFSKKNILSHYPSCFSKKNILSHYPSCFFRLCTHGLGVWQVFRAKSGQGGPSVRSLSHGRPGPINSDSFWLLWRSVRRWWSSRGKLSILQILFVCIYIYI